MNVNLVFSESPPIPVVFSDTNMGIEVVLDAKYSPVGGEPYSGSYIFTPTNTSQIAPTKGKTLSENIIINPIPNNYGLIGYNGFYLTVS